MKYTFCYDVAPQSDTSDFAKLSPSDTYEPIHFMAG